ncbi:hypothetical protein MCOL2_14798 [Listeria fleischmannii FSL S10-1203]|uniref:Uncharacterized protein n=1 Tax=Listeria fleischmannii FSL S10-1203 TaxID=1265822 RepID=W7DK27_9LIST|nr:hypothetical protein MCOL2_14798 [Listeria fleischmannii FSL S10-1203]
MWKGEFSWLSVFLVIIGRIKKLFALDFGCAVIAALLELAFPLAVNYVIDKLLPGKDFSMIITASLALLFFLFF